MSDDLQAEMRALYEACCKGSDSDWPDFILTTCPVCGDVLVVHDGIAVCRCAQPEEQL